MTYTFTVQIDLEDEHRPVGPRTLARAIARVLDWVKDCDVEGAEVLDQRFGQITVIPVRE